MSDVLLNDGSWIYHRLENGAPVCHLRPVGREAPPSQRQLQRVRVLSESELTALKKTRTSLRLCGHCANAAPSSSELAWTERLDNTWPAITEPTGEFVD